MNRAFFIGCCVVAMLAGRVALAADEPKPAEETKEQRDQRMKWWREARFGMFIHWGIYSVPAGTYDGKQIGGIGEWIMNRGKIPVAVYAKYAEQFNPVKFNADEWVSIAKNAGMKYMVITSKHHDGFAMFHSKVSPYNIYDATPFKRDPLAELSAACAKQGMKLGFYYSQAQDWHHPGGGAYGAHWDKAQDGDMDQYIKNIAAPQVKEILGNYGPVAVLWFDTPVGMNEDRVAQFLPLLKLQPAIIVNNRLGKDFAGDSETPEQFIPATGYPGRDWETCMTMNNTWGYKSYDNNWKPVEMLLKNLVDIASKGGNYLLNVGPTSEGLIPQPSVERLAEVGKWMKVNGDAIYGSSASPFKKLAFGRATRKDNKLFLHVFDWPKDGKLLVPMTTKVTKAYLLTAPDKALTVSASEQGVQIEVPAAAPDPIVSVVVAEVDGDIQPFVRVLAQSGDGVITLAAPEAELYGGHLRLEGAGDQTAVTTWTDSHDYIEWNVRVDKPGTFDVEMVYACAKDSGGADFTVSAGAEKLQGKITPTGSWGTYKPLSLGKLKIEKTGVVTIQVKAQKKPGIGVMNLQKLTLKPAN